jgi:hypothetical protein
LSYCDDFDRNALPDQARTTPSAGHHAQKNSHVVLEQRRSKKGNEFMTEKISKDTQLQSGVDGSALLRVRPASVVCTLAEGGYFNGVAALTNSLVHAGFEGSVVVGYRGSKPTWLAQFEKDHASDIYVVAPRVHLKIVELPGTWHLSNCKPHFIKQILLEQFTDVDLVFYFDADIVIKHSWDTFVGWAREGVVLVLDIADTYMPPHHVYRRAWQSLAAKQGLKCRDFTGYVNGGCVGINRAYTEFVLIWSALMEELERDGADMQKMRDYTGKLEFSRMDQDVLNATIMATKTPIALLGPEAMGMFPRTGLVMPHSAICFHEKPWDRKYLIDALRGFPPDSTHRAYWEFVDSPIRPFKRFKLVRKKTQVRIARLIGLLHTRSLLDV